MKETPAITMRWSLMTGTLLIDGNNIVPIFVAGAPDSVTIDDITYYRHSFMDTNGLTIMVYVAKDLYGYGILKRIVEACGTKKEKEMNIK